MSVMDRLFGAYWRPEQKHEHQWETIKEIVVRRYVLSAYVGTDYVYHLRWRAVRRRMARGLRGLSAAHGAGWRRCSSC